MSILDRMITAACGTFCAFGMLVVAATATAHEGERDHEHHHDSLVVSTDNGAVKGVQAGGSQQFLGIPYTAAPVGALRWKAPLPAIAWKGVRDASTFATHCPQPDTAFGRASNSSEDCLYLNVYRPASAFHRGDKLPVMVWIHGGALWLGESEDYNPADLVGRGVVVVTVNYRLGALGFLAIQH
jgi:para-nitrobenzyl esterase